MPRLTLRRFADLTAIALAALGLPVPAIAEFVQSAPAHAGAALVLPAREPAHAAAVTVGPIAITVPDGFVAAQTQRQKKSITTAWTKSVRNGSLKTLLQINVIDLGKPASPEVAEKVLRQFLSGIERRRTDYVLSPVGHIKLAGLPAVRATWNGAVGGRPVVGVMYSVIVQGTYAVVFQTQDLGSTPSSGMLEAMEAIDAATLTAPPHQLE